MVARASHASSHHLKIRQVRANLQVHWWVSLESLASFDRFDNSVARLSEDQVLQLRPNVQEEESSDLGLAQDHCSRSAGSGGVSSPSFANQLSY